MATMQLSDREVLGENLRKNGTYRIGVPSSNPFMESIGSKNHSPPKSNARNHSQIFFTVNVLSVNRTGLVVFE
jgi:hypothetical protein